MHGIKKLPRSNGYCMSSPSTSFWKGYLSTVLCEPFITFYLAGILLKMIRQFSWNNEMSLWTRSFWRTIFSYAKQDRKRFTFRSMLHYGISSYLIQCINKIALNLQEEISKGCSDFVCTAYNNRLFNILVLFFVTYNVNMCFFKWQLIFSIFYFVKVFQSGNNAIIF